MSQLKNMQGLGKVFLPLGPTTESTSKAKSSMMYKATGTYLLMVLEEFRNRR